MTICCCLAAEVALLLCDVLQHLRLDVRALSGSQVNPIKIPDKLQSVVTANRSAMGRCGGCSLNAHNCGVQEHVSRPDESRFLGRYDFLPNIHFQLVIPGSGFFAFPSTLLDGCVDALVKALYYLVENGTAQCLFPFAETRGQRINTIPTDGLYQWRRRSAGEGFRRCRYWVVIFLHFNLDHFCDTLEFNLQPKRLYLHC